MHLPFVVTVLGVFMMAGCAERALKPQEQYARDMAAKREWLRGPMVESCRSLPGPESRVACVMVIQRTLTKLRGDSLTREDHFRIELARAKGSDETMQLWTRAQQEAWLRGPRTGACNIAPFPGEMRWCLDGVQTDLESLNEPDHEATYPPDIRATHAVARIVAREQERAIQQQRAHELDLAQLQAAGHNLPGFGISGGFFGISTASPVAPGTPLYPLTAPTLPQPPVSCTSHHVGVTVQSDCY